MDSRQLFTGYSLNSVDTKGRVSLPAEFRAVIEQRVAPGGVQASDRKVYIGEHETLGCLIGYDASYQSRMSDAVDKRVAAAGPDADELRDGERMSLDDFASAAQVSYDEPGRMVLPVTRKLVGIDSQAFFFGVRHAFQIWQPEAFLASEVEAPRTKRVLELLLAEKKASRE